MKNALHFSVPACRGNYDAENKVHSFICFEACANGHDLLPLITVILKSATNFLLNNYCKVKNDSLNVKKIPNITVVSKNKRKLKTFSESSVKNKQDNSKT
ncbi:unnamed protein product [Larinioides sclopetarius]|uniref:Uncharacterized protein n=2 Tax=Larinioides sclopetarius TaxID=280406 RepID=A0AAV1ZKQ9_9ARAC